MARTLGDTKYAQGCRFEWFDRRPDNGTFCGWFFPDVPEDDPDGTKRLWITEILTPDGEPPSFFAQPGPGEPNGFVVPSPDMAAGYLAGWFIGREEW
ncbi:hypothetical protein [Streptomyces triticisoli]|jgi:hypothetical protein|uniref:hypothetical protein n=1 Tax=Streptomyces triticisoli TaxID=2182797 RepID=UPI000DDA2596|nr:hypothetical protein [Streptomyces triticisoli]